MKEQLEQIRYALDQSAIVASTDQAGNILFANDKFCEISGYSREELIGRNHRLLKSGFHDAEFFRNLWKTISAGQVWAGEIKNRSKNGNEYWVHTTIVPLVGKSGRPNEYISIRFEITNRKQVEEILRDYSKRLEVSNRELQDFASIAAHDLQEPLRKILAFSDRIKVKAWALLPPDVQDYLERMTKSTYRMQTLIDDLLTYSRIVTQAKPFTLTDLTALARDVVIDLEFGVERAQAEISIAELPKAAVDATQMRQLFQNLISNSIKFRSPGVVPKIEISGTVDSRAVRLSFKDNGIGFDLKYLDRIFTIFQRLHGRDEFEGTGIGLAVCRRIAERHSGEITAVSEPGKGAEFIVTLPIAY